MRVRTDVLALVAVALVLAVAFYGRSQDAPGLTFRVEGDTAYVNGTTTGRDQGAVRTLLRDAPEVDRLVFEIMPGTKDVTSNYRLARTIRKAGLATELTPDSLIASGAVDLFLAGQTRRVACGAMIGVHSWGSAGYDAQDVSFDAHRSMSRAFLRDMGIDPDFYDFRTEAAGSETVHWLTDAEIDRFNVATAPRDCG